MNSTVTALLFAMFIIVATLMLTRGDQSPAPTPWVPPVVMMENGKQVVTILAKGGYKPVLTIASSSVPTILRVKTVGDFDCSSALTIPQLNYRENLPPTATTDIPVPPQEKGTELRGICAMGMYNFSVKFE